MCLNVLHSVTLGDSWIERKTLLSELQPDLHGLLDLEQNLLVGLSDLGPELLRRLLELEKDLRGLTDLKQHVLSGLLDLEEAFIVDLGCTNSCPTNMQRCSNA